MPLVPCLVDIQIAFTPGCHHIQSDNVFQIVARSSKFDGSKVKFEDHAVTASHVRGGVYLRGNETPEVNFTIDPANSLSGLDLRVANQFQVPGFQYRGYVKLSFTPEQSNALLMGESIMIEEVCQDTFSADDEDTQEMINVGSAQITLTPTKKCANQSSVTEDKLQIYDQYQSSLMDIAQSANLKLDATYVYNKEMIESFKGSKEYVVLMHMGIPIEIRDMWQRRKESCVSSQRVLENILDVACVVSKCNDFEQVASQYPRAGATVLSSGFCAVVNASMYTDDRNGVITYESPEGAMTDRYTNLFGVARTLYKAGVAGAVSVGDCEDSANGACKLGYLFLHAPDNSSPRILAARKLMRDHYDCVTMVMMASNGKIKSQIKINDSRKYWSTASTATVAHTATSEKWQERSFAHTIGAMIPKGNTDKMAANNCTSGGLEPLISMEGTGWYSSEQTGFSPAERARISKDLSAIVDKASRGQTSVTCVSEVADRDMYRIVSHLTASNGKAYFIVDDAGVRSPHFARLLDDPGSLRLKAMLPTLTKSERDYYAVEMTKISPDFPIVLSEETRPEWATAQQISDHIQSDKRACGILRGPIASHMYKEGALGKYQVMCMPVCDGISVSICSC